ncbi:uncharacterized protein NECHADRAFT_49569 [Fusarium vanettenii 77-13-4]|uniref:DUF3669 domain-containing protein n=1 Tax=Fusarium vanettenii (strain ATCC MYA-4622 / CBS 123669 / FGSC 9596 / NRRL 45880 / 77-13-4) TaxID=660122 RepID=C7YTY1_FUSV7|nr:uncharacterized protein NECHADRAFT_49569 [Fusarium vanettenii 77-13-4]EEU44701.1 hypothetical protein NECHADRAFT_49569 [Fusarium vanettenii 77-13-4]
MSITPELPCLQLSAEDLDAQLHGLLSLDESVLASSKRTVTVPEVGQQQQEPFRKIGAGACGAIFGRPGKSIVIKLAKASDNDELWNDCVKHKHLLKQFKLHHVTSVRIPKCYGFVPKDRYEFWESSEALTQAAGPVCHIPTHGLWSERIQPLPDITRRLLIEKFCPQRVKSQALLDPANRDCLVRVYLGSQRGRSGGMFFSLRNFKMHLNHLVDLNLGVYELASSMATALAVMHWAAQTDARDVEFALGSVTEPLPSMSAAEIAALPPDTRIGPQSDDPEDFHHRKTVLWLLDFNQVRTITMDADGVAQAVEAFGINDPYYPRPL